MRLVDVSYISSEETEIARLLCEHPIALHHLTLLLNGYRDLIILCGETMEGDFADISISLAKRDMAVQHLGIPLLDRPADWERTRRLLYAAQQDEKEEEAEETGKA